MAGIRKGGDKASLNDKVWDQEAAVDDMIVRLKAGETLTNSIVGELYSRNAGTCSRWLLMARQRFSNLSPDELRKLSPAELLEQMVTRALIRTERLEIACTSALNRRKYTEAIVLQKAVVDTIKGMKDLIPKGRAKGKPEDGVTL
jgi:hypothetical protein